MLFNFPNELAATVDLAGNSHIREKRKIEAGKTDILYGEDGNKLFKAQNIGALRAEPNALEIYQAVAASDIDDRPFNEDHKPALYQEFFEKSHGLVGVFIGNVRNYHARRVACSVLAPWEDPIIRLDGNHCASGTGHRLRTAMFMGWDEVWVDYPVA